VATWAAFAAEAPELAADARRYFDAFKHKTLATIRKDGSPRISGSECEFTEDGQLTFGSMWQARKAQDLLRDPRFALHSGSADPDHGWEGDAKLAGTVSESVVESEAHGGRYHLFTADITEVVVVQLNRARDKLVIEAWHEGRGNSVIER
jgi:hypothetical protein